jgi:hypothetical protein
MSKELVLEKLESLGFSVVDAHKFGYVFEYEELTFLYMPDDDENFLRFALPNIFDVTTENRSFVLELVNDINMTIKYSKTCVFGENVWIFCEFRLFGDDNIEAIIEHGLLLLQATLGLFHRKIEETPHTATTIRRQKRLIPNKACVE